MIMGEKNMTDLKKFTMRDEDFECLVCHHQVTKLGYTARDHCPKCLCSRHVDVKPGDRQATCLGILRPVAVEKFKDTYKIVYKCDKCGIIKKNIMAKDDNMNLIIEIMSHPIQIYF